VSCASHAGRWYGCAPGSPDARRTRVYGVPRPRTSVLTTVFRGGHARWHRPRSKDASGLAAVRLSRVSGQHGSSAVGEQTFTIDGRRWRVNDRPGVLAGTSSWTCVAENRRQAVHLPGALATQIALAAWSADVGEQASLYTDEPRNAYRRPLVGPAMKDLDDDDVLSDGTGGHGGLDRYRDDLHDRGACGPG
jgi:hypothetical protein